MALSRRIAKQMFAIHWASIVIGIVIGTCIGVAITMWATLKAIENSSEFSDGFNKGWACGCEHEKFMIADRKDGDGDA